MIASGNRIGLYEMCNIKSNKFKVKIKKYRNLC